jgi:hypothetical protein
MAENKQNKNGIIGAIAEIGDGIAGTNLSQIAPNIDLPSFSAIKDKFEKAQESILKRGVNENENDKDKEGWTR